MVLSVFFLLLSSIATIEDKSKKILESILLLIENQLILHYFTAVRRTRFCNQNEVKIYSTRRLPSYF